MQQLTYSINAAPVSSSCEAPLDFILNGELPSDPPEPIGLGTIPWYAIRTIPLKFHGKLT